MNINTKIAKKAKKIQKATGIATDSPDLAPLIHGDSYNPHEFLGLHDDIHEGKVIRLWRPDAPHFHIELFGDIVEMSKRDPAGLFEYHVPAETLPTDYKVYHTSGLLAHDSYAFAPSIGELDQHLFHRGVHYDLYNVMGATSITHQGVQGVRFVVWAPSATRVSLVGDFNHWEGRTNPMRNMGYTGLWELFVPGLVDGEKYKYEIKTSTEEIRLKTDPFAFFFEQRPKTAAIVWSVDKHEWNDQSWMKRRRTQNLSSSPVNIYEVHLGSWKMWNGNSLHYRDLAHQLAHYCQEMGYTHVELLPIAEYPFDESWGYQVTGYYAPTSRYGTPEDFQYFVDHLHQNNIGVIVDWVPGHFPADDFALARFDGTCLYEHADPKQGYHPHWSTLIFNYGRPEVSNFLIANALYWFDKMHIDGLRVDAVASMLYLDYGRDEGGWIPNAYGGKENIEAIEFLRHTNSIVHQRHPGVVMIAEESTSFAGVSHPVEQHGLGFDMKWNMGWMNDTLRYISKDPIHRKWHHNDLTFGLLYAFSENFTLVFSHDESVHGKGSLLSKMPGDQWQQFANLRLLLSYLICQPGKKLLFMGGEFGQWNEWHCKNSLDWHLLEHSTHQGVHRMVKEINHLYLAKSQLWTRDFDYTGFEWVDFNDTDNSVTCYKRKSHDGDLLCIHNFTPNYHGDYFVQLPYIKEIREIFNSDNERYGGTGKINVFPHNAYDGHGNVIGVHIQLAPLATMIFEVRY
ncbi:1,4-alpha-glucan branching protein GlgB [Simkania negevensis]|uniref:1,4-alpha-glucan branching enzyme GlgB n=1 Tax=Simkania negevensis TaxID=83561 RepID=A0ABS3ARA7_9BACT|nr:1,4-alpha-glucan branching protein GlgB [Simkania negevensis]